MRFVRIVTALLVFSSAAVYVAKAGPTSGTVIVNTGGALAQDGSDTVPAGTIGTIVHVKTANGIVYVNVAWNGTAAFQGNYNGWVVDSSLSQYIGTGTTGTGTTGTGTGTG